MPHMRRLKVDPLVSKFIHHQKEYYNPLSIFSRMEFFSSNQKILVLHRRIYYLNVEGGGARGGESQYFKDEKFPIRPSSVARRMFHPCDFLIALCVDNKFQKCIK